MKSTEPDLTSAPQTGWRRPSSTPSLPEVHRAISVPKLLGFWRKLLAFAGTCYLVAFGYMGPGIWPTSLVGGFAFGNSMLCVILLSNLIAN